MPCQALLAHIALLTHRSPPVATVLIEDGYWEVGGGAFTIDFTETQEPILVTVEISRNSPA